MVKIWSHAVYGLKNTVAVLREVNEANEQLMHCRVYLTGGTLMVEAFLPIEPLVPALQNAPLLTILPLQVLSAAVAMAKGLDVDQPRNLAKSVTVE